MTDFCNTDAAFGTQYVPRLQSRLIFWDSWNIREECLWSLKLVNGRAVLGLFNNYLDLIGKAPFQLFLLCKLFFWHLAIKFLTTHCCSKKQQFGLQKLTLTILNSRSSLPTWCIFFQINDADLWLWGFLSWQYHFQAHSLANTQCQSTNTRAWLHKTWSLEHYWESLAWQVL